MKRHPRIGPASRLCREALSLLGALGLTIIASAAGSSSSGTSSGDSAARSYGESSRSAGADLSSEERDFLVKAAKGGMMEVRLGQLASTRATRREVRSYADRLVEDHQQANKKLEAIAENKGVDVATKKRADGADDTFNDLAARTGADFDAAFLDQMVEDHEETINLFEDLSDAGDPDIRAFVEETLPTLRKHLQTAQALRQKGD